MVNVPLSSNLAMVAAGACDSWDMRTSRVVFVVGCCSKVVIQILVYSQGSNISSAFVENMSNAFIICVVGWCYTRNAYKLFVIVAVLVLNVFFAVITFTVAWNMDKLHAMLPVFAAAAVPPLAKAFVAAGAPVVVQTLYIQYHHIFPVKPIVTAWACLGAMFGGEWLAVQGACFLIAPVTVLYRIIF